MYLCTILLAGLFNIVIGHVQKEMTIFVDSGRSECFYEKASEGNVIDIEYQVIDGGHGDLDVSFVFYDGQGLLVASDYKKSDNIHRLEVKVDGDHRFCFDNSFSTFNRKTVFFEIIVESDEEGKPSADEWGSDVLEGLTPEEFVDMKVSLVIYIVSCCCYNNWSTKSYSIEFGTEMGPISNHKNSWTIFSEENKQHLRDN